MSTADVPTIPTCMDDEAEVQCEPGELVGEPASFRQLVEEHPDGLLILGLEKVVLYANPAACRLLKRIAVSLSSVNFLSLIHTSDLPRLSEGLERLDSRRDGVLHCTLRCQQGAGDWAWVECVGRQLPSLHAGAIMMVLRDLGTHQEQLERLTQLAFTDPVTGLANRTLLLQRLEHRLKLRDLHLNPVGILSIDLDGFKRVNDTFGHAAGDELLRQFGARLRQLVRDCDTVARIGGDEFVVMLEEVLDLHDVAVCAERLMGALGAPMYLDGREVTVSASIGLALGTTPEVPANELLKGADLALYRAKASGKGRYAVYDELARVEVMERSTLQADLRRALQNDELCLFYQPEVELETGQVRSIEALLRWRHPHRGLIEATELLPLMRQAALGRAVRRWVHQEACRQAYQWSVYSTADAKVQVTVNLSDEDLQCDELVPDLERSLQEVGVSPQHLVFECPESILIENTSLAIRRMHAFRKMGVGLAIDSFGARFGSLRLLESLPVQAIKVDQSLADGAAGNRSILKAVCAIARDLKVSVTAKCIETLEQRSAVLQARCKRGQGYLFSPPLARDEMTRLLHSRSRLPEVRGSGSIS